MESIGTCPNCGSNDVRIMVQSIIKSPKSHDTQRRSLIQDPEEKIGIWITLSIVACMAAFALGLLDGPDNIATRRVLWLIFFGVCLSSLVMSIAVAAVYFAYIFVSSWVNDVRTMSARDSTSVVSEMHCEPCKHRWTVD